MNYKERLNYITNALKEMEYALNKNSVKNKDAIFYFYAAQKKAEEVIETAITLNQDLLYDQKNHMTKSYHDSFIDLKVFGILPEEVLKKLAMTVGFRNRLAHEYVELDPQITINSMNQLLKLYPDYVRAMKKYLSK